MATFLLLASLVAVAAVAAEPAIPAGCPTGDPIRALACLERKLASGASVSPRQGVAAAMARYNLRLVEESPEAARQALDEAFRINAQVSDPVEQGKNYVELLSTFDLDPAGQQGEVEAPRLDGRAEKVAKAFAARLGALPAGPGDDSLLALVHRIFRASDAGGVSLAQLAEVFIPAVREVSAELGRPAGTDADNLVRLARRVSLLLLAERAFLQVYANRSLLAFMERSEGAAPVDLLPPDVEVCRQIFEHLSEPGRRNLVRVHDQAARQLLEQGNLEGAASLAALTLSLLRPLPPDALAIRSDVQAYTGLLLADFSIDLGRTDEARRILDEAADAITRMETWSPRKPVNETLLARARERLGTPFAGHARGIQAVAAAPDGDLVVTVGQDSTVRLWTSEGKVLASRRRAHSGAIYTVAVSPAGDRIASGGEDGSIRLWNREGSPVGEPLRASGIVFGLAFSPRGGLLAAGTGNGALEIHALESAGPPKSLAGHEGDVYTVAFSPEGDLLASGGQEGTVRLWKPDGSPAAEPLRGHTGSVFSVAFSPRGDLLASAGKDGSIRLWDRTGASADAPLWGHVGDVLSVAFSPSGELLASSGLDGTVRLWSVRERRQVAAVRGHEGHAWSVTFPTGEILLSAGEDNTVRRWQVQNGEQADLRSADGRSGPESSAQKAIPGFFLGDKDKDILEPLRRFDAAALSPRSSPSTPVQEATAELIRVHLHRIADEIRGAKNALDLALRISSQLEPSHENTGLVIELALLDLIVGDDKNAPLEALRQGVGSLLSHDAPEGLEKIPSLWLLLILSDHLAGSADPAGAQPPAIRLGEFATAFIRLSRELRGELPLPATAGPGALRTAARKVGMLLLGESLFFGFQEEIFAPEARLDLTGFSSLSELYAAILAAMTPQKSERLVERALLSAEHALLDPASFESSAERFRMLAELLHQKPPAFEKAPVFAARAHLQSAYLNIAAGQIFPARLNIDLAEGLLTGAPESREKSYSSTLLHRIRGGYTLLVGNAEEAARELETAATLFDEIQVPSLSTRALLSQVYAMQGDFGRAIAVAETGLARLPHLRPLYDTSDDEALLDLALAQAYWRSGRLPEMKDRVDQALRLPLAAAMRDQAHFLLSIYHLDTAGGCREAVPLLDELIARKSFHRSDFEEKALISLARCYSERDEPERARPHLKRAVDLNRNLRQGRWSSPYYDTIYVSAGLPELERLVRTTFFDLMSRGGPDRGELERELLYHTETLRSRQLLDEIELRGGILFTGNGTSPEDLEKLQAMSDAPLLLIGAPLPEHPEAATVEKLQALTARLSKRNGLPTVLLEYLTIPERDRVVLYVIQETSLDLLVLDTRWAEVEEGINRLRRYIALALEKYTELRSSPQPDPWLVQRIARLEKEIDLLGQSLGTALLPAMPGNSGSLAELLRGKSVVIVPHGALHGLPFPALRIGSEYLLDLVGRFSVAPSALSLDALLTYYTSNLASEVEDLLLVGDWTDPGLPFVAAEFAALAALSGRPWAVSDKATMKQGFPEASAVHFGTHAFYDSQDPASSGLLLGDEILTLLEITDAMKTHRTRLVTLGACESSLAEASQVGDDVWSLATGFLYTGAPAVVASLWLQDGASSLVFYRSFYRSVLAGEEIGAAFRHAVLEVRAQARQEELAGGALRGLDNPAFWAGFTFLGE